MTNLAQHIETLLLENDCVVIPNFGGFVVYYTPAMKVKGENVFSPPIRTIGFNSQLKLNDGILVQSYMAAHDTNFSDATRLVGKEVASLINTLHEEGVANLENIGEIRYNIRGCYEFTPYNHKITTPFLYGLDSFEMQELISLQRNQKALIPRAKYRGDKKTYKLSLNRRFLQNTAAVIAAIVSFYVFSTPVENTSIPFNNYAQLHPYEFFEQIKRSSVVATPISNQKAISDSKRPDFLAKKGIEKNTSKTITAKEIKVKEQKVPAIKLQVNHPYHIIVAGGISLKDAEKIVSQLKSKNFIEATVLNNDGKIRVSIRSFSTREEATKLMIELRKNEIHKNAWLLAI